MISVPLPYYLQSTSRKIKKEGGGKGKKDNRRGHKRAPSSPKEMECGVSLPAIYLFFVYWNEA